MEISMSTHNQFIRIYQRASKSIWDDKSTVLLLANHRFRDEELCLDFNRYIYLHRDVEGKILGLSLSKAIVSETEMECSQYVSGEMMYVVLLLYIDEITAFCELFAEQFEALFLTSPTFYFGAMSEYWLEKLE